MFDIEYEFRQEDLIHFNETRVKKNPEIQNEIRKHRIFILGAMLFISFFYYLYYKDIEISVYILALSILWIFGFKPYELKMDIRRQILAKYTEAEKEAMFGEYKLSIEPEHLIEKSATGKHKIAWKDLIRIEETDKYVYVYVDLDTALIIPKETLKSGDLKQFVKQAEGMIERAS